MKRICLLIMRTWLLMLAGRHITKKLLVLVLAGIYQERWTNLHFHHRCIGLVFGMDT